MYRWFTFETPLGWMGLVLNGRMVCQLSLGYRTASAALRSLRLDKNHHPPAEPASEPLVARLKAYASGEADDFRDVPIDTSHLSPLGQAVSKACRRIPYGRTRTYGQLAAEVGHPQAARAIGRFMASNRVPILVPCHRVVAADGRLGGFSAPGGVAFKRRLLEMESRDS